MSACNKEASIDSHSWVCIENDTLRTVHRMKIPGGWLYLTEITHTRYGVGAVGDSAIVNFVPEYRK